MVRFTALIAFCSLAACGGSGPTGPKTPINDTQFAELIANCDLQGATVQKSNSTSTTTEADGSTSTVTTNYDGPADQKTIVLTTTMSDEAVGRAIICIKGELDRMNADARVQPPINMDLGF